MVKNFSEEELEQLRLKASACWHIAGKLGTKDSPLVTEITSRLEEFMGIDSERDFFSGPTEKELGDICDELILVPDASVRVMTLLSMWFLEHRSVHLGFISTLISSEEKGELIVYGKPCGAMNLRDQTHSYLLRIFDFRQVLLVSRLKESIRHWESVLDGYAHDYYYPKRSLTWKLRSEEGEKPTPKKIKKEALTHFQDALKCFAKDVKGIIVNIGLTDIAQKRKEEIKRDLMTILHYNFTAEQSPLITLAVLNELAWLGGYAFPCEWLIKIIDTMPSTIDFSSQLKNLLLLHSS